MAQQKRGFKYALSQVESLLEVIDEIIPIGNPDWERVWNEHAACYPTKNWTAKLLKRKFQKLAHTKHPTNDPNCPYHVWNAKHIYYKIVLATDGSTGGSEDGGDLGDERDGEIEGDNNKMDGEYNKEDDEEDGMVESNNNSFSFSADKQE
jgi:hypothetical protein